MADSSPSPGRSKEPKEPVAKPRKDNAGHALRASVGFTIIATVSGAIAGAGFATLFDSMAAQNRANIQAGTEQAAASYADFVSRDVHRQWKDASEEIRETISIQARMAVYADTVVIAGLAAYIPERRPTSFGYQPSPDLIEIVRAMRRDLGKDKVNLDYLQVLLVRPAQPGSGPPTPDSESSR